MKHRKEWGVKKTVRDKLHDGKERKRSSCLVESNEEEQVDCDWSGAGSVSYV